jgi:energy-coupling factor transporter transmembrane protein EcfT
MLKLIIIIVVALFLFMLFWKLMKNVVKALVVVVILLLLFGGILFIRDYSIIKSVTSSDRLIVLEENDVPIIGIKNQNIIKANFKTPYISMEISKIDFEYSGEELVLMLQSEDEDLNLEAIKVLNDALSNDFLSYIDKNIINIKPEPYFMALLKGSFKEKLKSDINLVGSAIKSKASNYVNMSNSTNLSFN